MRPLTKPLLLVAALPLVFVGCTSTNPKGAFDDVSKTVAARTGQQVRWMRDDAEADEIEKAVEALLQTNLTAQAAVAIALLNNRTLQAEFESIGISQAELAQASRLKNPTYAGFYRVPLQGAAGLNTENALTQNLLDLLMLPVRKKIAARNLASVKLRVTHEVLALSEEAQIAFYTVQARQQLTNRLSIIVEINEAGADIAQRQFDAGNINALELKNQEALFAQSRFDLARAEAQTRVDRERLNRLLGVWGKQTGWQITDVLPALPEKDLPLENVEATAVNRRLDLAAARGEVMAISSALGLSRDFRYLPGVTIGANAERDLDGSWVAGPTLSLEVPIFDQGQAGLAKLAAEYRRAQRHFEALAVNIRSEVRAARDALITSRDAADYHAKVLLPQRQSILRETLLQFNAMQKSNYELLLAKEREQQEEQAAIEALRDYWIARAKLERAAGGRLTDEIPSTSSPPPTKQEEHKHH
jgi:cobalt-zinc-cadmium efflux system outer membrane protein